MSLRHEMGSSVSRTPVEKIEIDNTNDQFGDNDIQNIRNANKINGFADDDLNIQNQFTEQSSNDQNWGFNYGMSNLG